MIDSIDIYDCTAETSHGLFACSAPIFIPSYIRRLKQALICEICIAATVRVVGIEKDEAVGNQDLC
jgi:hypothetical protein